MTRREIADALSRARARDPEASFGLVVASQRWPGIQFGQRVRIVGRLTGRFVMEVSGGSLLDVYFGDIEGWLLGQERRRIPVSGEE